MKIVLRGGGKKIVLRQTGRRGPAGAGLPTGGTTGQVPVKQSAADYDIAWETPPTAPVTSVNGQTGAVVLDAGDVGADVAGSAAQALSDANDYTDSAVAGVDTGVMTVVAGNNVTVDNTDPSNPVVSAADAPTPPVTSVNGSTGDVVLTGDDIESSNGSGVPISNELNNLGSSIVSLTTTVNQKANQSDLTAHTSNTNNPHSVTKSQVGLGNVDNTSDADKPISTATQNALNLKLDASRVLQGTGFPNGVVTAPVGTIYVDTAVTNGASSWIKKSGTGNTGWVVLEGDTGWRNITSLVDSAKWDVDGRLRTRRVNERVDVILSVASSASLAAGQHAILSGGAALPLGFRDDSYAYYRVPVNRTAAETRNDKIGPTDMNILVNGTGSSSSDGTFRGRVSFTTTNDWPTTLPGTPA